MLTIETECQTTEAQAKEIVNVSVQIKKLIKSPEKKFTDYFKFCPRSMAFALLMIVFCFLFVLKFGGDALIYSCLGVFGFSFIIILRVYSSVNGYKKHLLSQSGNVTVIFDEDGVDYDNHKDKKLKLSWEGTAFIRVLSECLYVVPKDMMGVMICLKVEYTERVLSFVEENNIGIEVIK